MISVPIMELYDGKKGGRHVPDMIAGHNLKQRPFSFTILFYYSIAPNIRCSMLFYRLHTKKGQKKCFESICERFFLLGIIANFIYFDAANCINWRPGNKVAPNERVYYSIRTDGDELMRKDLWKFALSDVGENRDWNAVGMKSCSAPNPAPSLKLHQLFCY